MKAADFYDGIAPTYHLLYPAGLDAAILDHGETLHRVIQENWGTSVHEVLDAACGIGTQAIGLAGKGYRVAASDIAPMAIARAKREALEREAHIAFEVVDLRQLHAAHKRQFDVVIAVDNAVACLLSDDEVLAALQEMYACVRPGGGCLLSVHDYEHEDLASGQIRPYPVRQGDEGRYFIFQVWDFDGPIYDLSLYVVRETGAGQVDARVLRTKSYAIRGERLMALMRQAGFQQVRKLAYRFAQPFFVGTRIASQD